MTTFGELVDSVFLTLEGWGLNVGRAAFLNEALGIDAAVTSFEVDDASNLGEGLAEIEDELIYIQSVSGTTVTVSPDGRGYRGTTAAAHDDNTRITMNPILPREVVKQKINETITGTYPALRGKTTTEITQVGTQVAYEVPADLDDVLSLTYQAAGPSQVWPRINHWRLDLNADTTVFATGKSLDVYGPVEIGSTMRLTYLSKPSALSDTGDLLTASGLAETARACIVAGAVWRLSSYVSAARLRVSTTSTDFLDEQNTIQDATRTAAYLRAQYEVELQEEKDRQDRSQPVVVNNLD